MQIPRLRNFARLPWDFADRADYRTWDFPKWAVQILVWHPTSYGINKINSSHYRIGLKKKGYNLTHHVSKSPTVIVIHHQYEPRDHEIPSMIWSTIVYNM